MNCAAFEILLADYLDNTLGAPERAALEAHVSSCAGCRDLLNDAGGALSFLQRAEEVEIPAELITRIAYLAPTSRVRDPFERQSFFSRLISRWLQPILQPRLVMGMAMTILSFAMLERCTGVRVQRIEAADLNPVRIWGGVEDRAIRVKDRAVKYYENLRWVYEIEVRLRSLQDQTDTAPEQAKQPSGDQKSRQKTNGVKKP
jgi:anti-sigma factor RsiW